jgi:hypothetical protein
LPCRLSVADVTASGRVNSEIAYALFLFVSLLLIVVGRRIKSDSLARGLEGRAESILDPVQCSLPSRGEILIWRSVWRWWHQSVQHIFEDLTRVWNRRVIEEQDGEEAASAVRASNLLAGVL